MFPSKERKAQVLYLHGLGKSADLAAIEKLVAAGNDVLAFDLRGMGETSPGAPSAKPGFFGSDFKETYLALHLNRPLLGQRVYDLLAMIEHFKASKVPIHIVGVQAVAPIALHAAALEPRIESVTLDKSLLSWAAVVRSPITYNQLTNVVPGALKVYDLPDLATLIAPRPLTIHAVDAKGEAVTQAAIDEAYANCRQAYENSKAADRLVLNAAK
jgi:pimeloyl-ACP methyl ester carboxylesterase